MNRRQFSTYHFRPTLAGSLSWGDIRFWSKCQELNMSKSSPPCLTDSAPQGGASLLRCGPTAEVAADPCYLRAALEALRGGPIAQPETDTSLAQHPGIVEK